MVLMHDIFEKVRQVLHDCGFALNKLLCLSTNVATNMVGRHNEVAAKLQKTKKNNLHRDSSFTHFHRIIYQHNLHSKVSELYHMLSLVTKTIKYKWRHDLNQHQFSQLSGGMKNQFIDVPFYTETRWLWCHKVLKRFYLLRQEIIMFLEMESQNKN